MVDVLLDTHVFIWWDARSPRLGETAKGLISAPANRVFVSAASIWEVAIKRGLGKLAFARSPTFAIQANSLVELAISGADCESAGELEWDHADPFDRLIVAQALRRSLTLITADDVMQRHMGVAVVPAN